MHGGRTSSAWTFQRDSLFSRRKVPQFSLGGFESHISSILVECCGTWHNGALALFRTRWHEPMKATTRRRSPAVYCRCCGWGLRAALSISIQPEEALGGGGTIE